MLKLNQICLVPMSCHSILSSRSSARHQRHERRCSSQNRSGCQSQKVSSFHSFLKNILKMYVKGWRCVLIWTNHQIKMMIWSLSHWVHNLFWSDVIHISIIFHHHSPDNSLKFSLRICLEKPSVCSSGMFLPSLWEKRMTTLSNAARQLLTGRQDDGECWRKLSVMTLISFVSRKLIIQNWCSKLSNLLDTLEDSCTSPTLRVFTFPTTTDLTDVLSSSKHQSLICLAGLQGSWKFGMLQVTR